MKHWLVGLVALACACGGGESDDAPPLDAAGVDTGSATDGGAPDTATPRDTGAPSVDSGPGDAGGAEADGGAPEDAGADAGAGRDAGGETDAGSTADCPDARCYCERTLGVWDEAACGHYVCGVPNDCEALIPGCDCGDNLNFVEGAGCVIDVACGCGDARCFCEGTGGVWDEAACGNYFCGMPNPCDAVIPGCDCGEGRNFVASEGCAAADICVE